MAGHPLRSATDRRLGKPLPYQLANQTRAHLTPPEFLPLHHAVLWPYAVLAVISNCYPPVWGRLPTRYSPVRRSVKSLVLPKDSKQSASLDLHVLGTPPAFILSQDQTLVKSVCSVQELLLAILSLYCVWFVKTVLRNFLFKEIFSLQRNFQGLLSIVQLSRFLSFFPRDSFDILSNPFRFVKNFFWFIFSNQLSYISIFQSCLSRTFSTIFYSFSSS